MGGKHGKLITVGQPVVWLMASPGLVSLGLVPNKKTVLLLGGGGGAVAWWWWWWRCWLVVVEVVFCGDGGGNRCIIYPLKSPDNERDSQVSIPNSEQLSADRSGRGNSEGVSLVVVFCFVPFCLLVCLLGLALGMSIKLQYKFNSVDYGDRGGEKKKQKKKIQN